MVRQLILTVLLWRLHDRVGGGAISNALGNAEVVLQEGAVGEMTVSVMFGALHVGPPVTLGRFPLVDNIPRADNGGGFSTDGALIS